MDQTAATVGFLSFILPVYMHC